MTARARIGIDLGGTKIAGIVLGGGDAVLDEQRLATPHGEYAATVTAISGLVADLERNTNTTCTVGIGMPGSISPRSGLVQNANSVWLNGKPFGSDIATALGREVKLANDANCFALSEAADGAAAGAQSMFGVILGTGCGGGLVMNGRLIDGPNGIGGEWGHNPLPWPNDDEFPGPECWCGRRGCIETWLSGPGLAADHERAGGARLSGEVIVSSAGAGDAAARRTLERHAGRLGRALAHVINIFDPEVIVLGGGLSALEHLYRDLPGLVRPHIFASEAVVGIRPPRWGDASGVRGAARLWGSAG